MTKKCSQNLTVLMVRVYVKLHLLTYFYMLSVLYGNVYIFFSSGVLNRLLWRRQKGGTYQKGLGYVPKPLNGNIEWFFLLSSKSASQ